MWPGLALALRKLLTAGLTLPCAGSGRLCPSPGAAARGKPALQAKQRKVRVSGRELCPRLRKHILAEERNTIQAGRETQLPSNPLQEAFGSLQLLESSLTIIGLFIVAGFHVFVFLSFTPACCRGERTEQYRSSTAWRVEPCTGDRQPGFPFLPVTISLCGLGACHFPLCPGSSVRWGGSTQQSPCRLFTYLCPCRMPWRRLRGSWAGPWPWQAQTRCSRGAGAQRWSA